MSFPNDPPRKGSGWGCLIAVLVAVAVIVAVGAMIASARKSSRLAFERKKVAWATERFEKVKAGDDGSHTSVFLDPLLIEMLANDAECVANLTTLNLSSVDLNGPQTDAAEKLVNVKKVVFYDCDGAGRLLTALSGLESIKELSFDTTQLTDDDVPLLATFPNLRRVHFAWVNSPAREKLIRDTLPGVDIQIDE
jgi:hypothetical protein